MSDTDMTERNISLAAGCMRSSVEYSRIYAKYAHGERGFYSKHTSGTIAIIAPVEGLLFLAPEP
ncbi:hypothetical protein C8N35_106134 [Breoghania corrubedonensis]|uniref:Uncharacterized protein n=2 Tax=Breoghania corrubedonensis TaxID=665038 RepID=A0A2T5V7M1_9HYPH|nr:hypothetical protein C8N35_106134 [Breoghania corrubedonensis]